MRIASIVLGLTAAGCIKAQNVPCEDSDSCNLASGGACVAAPTRNQWCAYPDTTCPSGQRYSDYDVGDGLSGACVGETPSDGPDAGVTDASLADAPPRPPIVTSGQAADLVVGAPTTLSPIDFQTVSRSRFGLSSSIGTDGTRLWVSDGDRNRVLEWSAIPTENDTPSNLVLGQRLPTTSASGLSRAALNTAGTAVKIAAVDGQIYVPDIQNHRIMVFTSPAIDGADAAFVLGQQTFTTNTRGSAANQMNVPTGVWTDGTKLAIADYGNNRVLLWDATSRENGQPATRVLGQRDFGLSGFGVSATAMSGPQGVYFDGEKLYVADTGNNRVLVWNGWPSANGQPAAFVLGQTDFVSRGLDGGATQPPNMDIATAVGMEEPTDVLTAHGALFVVDSGNSRLMVWQSVPMTTGAAADFVLGAPNVGVEGGRDERDRTLTVPKGVVVVGDKLFVAETTRVVRFRLNAP